MTSTTGPAWKTLILNLNLLTFGLGQILLYSLFPVLIEQTRLGLEEIILCFSIGTLLFLIGAPFWSGRADRCGHPGKVLFLNMVFLWVSLALFALLFLVPLSTKAAFGVLLLSRLIYGLGASGLPSVAQGLRLQLSETALKSMFAHSAFLNLGRTLGPCLLFIPLLPWVLLTGLVLWTGLVTLLTWGLCFTGPYSVSAQRVAPPGSHLLRRISKMLYPGLITLSFSLILGLVHSGLSFKIQTILSLSAAPASLLLARLLLAGSAIMVIVQVLGKRLPDHKWRYTLIIGGCAFIAGFLFLVFAQIEAALYFGMGLFALGLALLQPSNVLLLENMNLPREERNQRLGHLSAINTLGYAGGGLLLSININYQELLAIILCIILILTCTAGVWTTLNRRHSHHAMS